MGHYTVVRVHEDIIKWKSFPHYWPFVREIDRSPVDSPHKGQWRRALMFSLIGAWANGWTNRRCAHYDVTVMWKWCFCALNLHKMAPIAEQTTFQWYFDLNFTEVRSYGSNNISISRLAPEGNCPVPPQGFNPWWRHQMGTFSALLAFYAGNSPVAGEFRAQRPVTQNFDVFFDLCLNKRLSKQSRRWWFETLSRSLWRHCNAITWTSSAFTKLHDTIMHHLPLTNSKHTWKQTLWVKFK